MKFLKLKISLKGGLSMVCVRVVQALDIENEYVGDVDRDYYFIIYE